MLEFFYFLQKKFIVTSILVCFSIVFPLNSTFAQNATLEKGSYTIRPIRVLEVNSEEPIILTGDTVLAADSILIDSTIVTNGFQFRLDARTITWGASGEIVAFTEAPNKPPTPPQAPRGPDGVPFPNSLGSPHSIRDGGHGLPGETGNPGIPGSQNPGALVVVSIDTVGALRIDARGQLGGMGGDGGQGGNGGDGVRGRDGSCSCSTAGVSCSSFAGALNNGGTSGNGGKGGKGGTAGRGGNAVPLILAIGEIETALETASIQLSPGSSGDPGKPGDIGSVGSVGAAGRADGCCADISLFGLNCGDASGAGPGRAINHPAPGDLGKGDANQAGDNIDLAQRPVADYAYGAPLTSPTGVVNGFGVSLEQIADQQLLVFRDLTAFNISRTFAYLLRRSISIAKTSQLASDQSGVIPQVISDLWEDNFVDPLQVSVDSGASSNPEQAKAWLAQGKEVVRLFSNYENPASQAALDTKFSEVSAQVDLDAQSLIRSCASYGSILAQNTDELLISHQISIPACTQVPALEGIQLIVAPLEVREQLPPLPSIFEKFELNVQDVEIIPARLETPFLGRILGLFAGTAHAQSIIVEVEEDGAPVDLIDPNDVRLGLSAGIESRYVIESVKFTDEEPYTLTQLGIDLLILGSVAR